ncbi:MAG TPA: peptidoglycan editing factor PgeF [Bdellovibrio sp.]
MNIEQTPLGYELRTPHLTVLMGNINSQYDALKKHYSQFDFVRLKQIHSDAVVKSNDSSLDYQVLADAHYTSQSNLALCVITADCVPLFLFDPATKLIAGVHAGWRGVATRIIPKTIQALTNAGVKAENLQVLIGPHIQKNSFQVDVDVRDQIVSSLGPLSASERSLIVQEQAEKKSLVDLNLIVKMQLTQNQVSAENVFDLHIDTVASLDFHSYRRDKEKSGRQVSFICKNL